MEETLNVINLYKKETTFVGRKGMRQINNITTHPLLMCVIVLAIESLSTRVFETRTATGRKHFAY